MRVRNILENFLLTFANKKCKIFLSNICSKIEVKSLDREILHVDCNKFFASVECLHRPEIRNKPVAVGGDSEKRHGIVLTCNEIAKAYGIKTAEQLWQARRKCPQLVVVPPNYPLYLR